MSRVRNTKDRIVASATELFNERGVHAVSTNHIAAHCKISPGNLYYHFKNKEEIIAAIFQGVAASLDSLNDVYHDQPLVLVQHYIDSVFAILFEYPFFFNELNQLLRKDPELAANYGSLKERFQGQLADLFFRLSTAGVCRGLEDPADRIMLARNLWIVSTFWHNYQDHSSSGHEDRDLIAGLLAQVYFQLRPYLDDVYQATVKQLFAMFEQRLTQRMGMVASQPLQSLEEQR